MNVTKDVAGLTPEVLHNLKNEGRQSNEKIAMLFNTTVDKVRKLIKKYNITYISLTIMPGILPKIPVIKPIEVKPPIIPQVRLRFLKLQQHEEMEQKLGRMLPFEPRPFEQKSTASSLVS